MLTTTCYDVFERFVSAANSGVLIESESDNDKEFHFQNWVGDRLDELSMDYDELGRNTYPDYRLVHFAEGYEVKGLKSPGRIASYDSNSQVPSGLHHGRRIFYIFGLYPKSMVPYPKAPDGRRRYPLMDLVVCHGDFLNADNSYIHKNKSVKGFGTYGDILIRDRKMYVPPTPFAVTEGLGGFRTLIVPECLETTDSRFQEVGRLTRIETSKIITGYTFDLQTNTLTPEQLDNPNSGVEHHFVAYRLKGDPSNLVSIRAQPISSNADDELDEDCEGDSN